jgi:nitrate reductase NapE component
VLSELSHTFPSSSLYIIFSRYRKLLGKPRYTTVTGETNMHFIIGFVLLVLAFGLFPRVALAFTVLGALGVAGFFAVLHFLP